jgi:hypothetical protein
MDGCRITFAHRRLPGAVLWGVGEGWHGFLDQLAAYLDGNLDRLAAEIDRHAAQDDTTGIRQYRACVSRQLLTFAQGAASDARSAAAAGNANAATAAIDQLELAARQLHRIAQQEGVRPDFTVEGATTVDL